MSFIADPLAQLRCCYCQEDITGLRIRCVECREFDICLQCFVCGAEIGTHKSDHDYQFMESGSFNIFSGSSSWTAREELRLLDAIEQFGYGNWEDISKHIETKNPQETKDEFCSMYIHGNMGQALWPNTVATHISKDHTSQYTGPLSPSLTSKLPPVDVSLEDSAQLGYMPLRDDFEREFDNEGENTVSHLCITNEDEDIDIGLYDWCKNPFDKTAESLSTALKLAHVDIYTRKLRERARRKRIARDYHLVEQFLIQRKKEGTKEQGKKKGLKADKEIEDKMRVFTQFHTPQEHEEFLKGLKRERDLKIRIKELIRYRRNGITTQTECIEYEAERYYREQRKENRRRGGHPLHMFAFHLGPWKFENSPKLHSNRKRKKRTSFTRKKDHSIRR